MGFASFLLDLFFPPFCAGCGKLGTYFCPSCYQESEFLLLPIKVQFSPQFIDKVFSLAHYQPPITHLIKQAKYQHVPAYASLMGEMLQYCCNYPQVDVCCPIPGDPVRTRQRGFNPATVIARSFSRFSQIPLCELLQKTHGTAAQASITDREERLQRLSQLFTVNPTLTVLPQPSLSCLIIDDVTTTGATLNEAARVLKQELGFSRVYGLTIAHGA